jgi:predicted RNase H-like nuclease (RuvC/YqgF family)
VGKAIGTERRDFQRALDRRDREIKLLRRELGALRNEVELKLNLKSELAAAQAEVEELRQRAPNFKRELADLQVELQPVAPAPCCWLPFRAQRLTANPQVGSISACNVSVV